ncbi:MAG: endolytic transglycosylase MltG [Candidatus Levyibacteriota bacterium]
MKRIIVAFVLVLAISVLTTLWWKNNSLPVNSQDKTQKIFVVQKGQGVREISSKLKKENLIKDSIVFFIITKRYGYDKKIEAGDFRLSPSMATREIAEKLTHGTLDVWVIIPEGKRAEEVAEILEEKVPSYEDTWINDLKEHEGYLFPDTYLFPKDADIDLIISIMKNNFESKFNSVKNSKTTNLTENETITLASLVEREAKADVDRPLIASVIYNRLNIGMKLDIDATLQYMLGYQEAEKRWWKKALTNDDKKINSPFNTYTNPGLPPRPISNPGIASIKAALNPASTNYLFYISDASGKNRYGETIEEHHANIRNYGL